MKKFLFITLCLLVLYSCQREKSVSLSATFPFLVWGFSIEGFPISKDNLDQLEKETKLSVQLIQFYLQWPTSLNQEEQNIISSLNAINEVGAIPCITWEPMLMVEQKEEAISYESILGGQYDPYLNHLAKQIKEWEKPLIIRFAHEMNLKRYHWGTTEEQFGPHSPDIYIQMFRYVVTFFNDHQVKNVLWAFCPNVDSIPNEFWNKATNYYPGDQYIDILGMDGYNWAITAEIAKRKESDWIIPWRSFEEIFNNIYQELKQISLDKPIIVFETASVEREGGKKSVWIKEALETAKKWQLMGIIWFQANKEEDWRIHQHEDYSYLPMIRSAIPPFQEGLLNYVKRRYSLKDDNQASSD